jgi:hypothetical protein
MDWSYGHDANHEEQPAQQTNSDVEGKLVQRREIYYF